MESIMKTMGRNETELNIGSLENAAGGTPKSITGGKRSGRRSSETALEILQRLGDLGSGILEGPGLKQKRVDNSIADKRLPEDWMNS